MIINVGYNSTNKLVEQILKKKLVTSMFNRVTLYVKTLIEYNNKKLYLIVIYLAVNLATKI